MSSTTSSSLVALTPVPSFFNAPVAELEDLTEGDLAVVGVYCDHYCEGEPGARFHPRQLRYAYASEPNVSQGRVFDLGDLSIFPLDAQGSADIVADQAWRLANTGARTLAISGDYGLTSAFLSGIRKVYPEGRLGVLRLSNRPDLNATGNTVLSRRNASTRITSLDENVSIFVAGLSGLVPDEERPGTAKLFSVTARELRHDLTTSINALKQWGGTCNKVYLSVDADILMPSCARSARWHGEGGLSRGDVANIIQSTASLPLIGAELTGFIPDLDIAGRTRRAMCLEVSDAVLNAMMEALG